MPLELFLQALAQYEKTWVRHYPDSGEVAERFRRLLNDFNNCFDRDCFPGHVTASALVTDPSRQNLLLTHHAKLNKWLQLGGHCDGVADPHLTAHREILEESGMRSVSDLRWNPEATEFCPIFDLDIHLIPARKLEPEHFHYDVRYLFEANEPQSIQVSAESNDLQWLSLEASRRANPETSMIRLFDKFEQVMLK